MPPDYRAYARDAATRNPPLDPGIFVRQIDQESGFDPNAYNAASGATGIAQLIPRFHPDVDPTDPRASLDYAARWMGQMTASEGIVKALASYDWGPGNVASWDGRRSSLPAETQRYLDAILGPGWPEPAGPAPKVVYDRDTPALAQNDPWSCGPTSTRWAMTAVGRHPTEAWMESQMIAEDVANPQVGVTDHTGAGIAAFIREQYGEFGYDSNNDATVTFDALAAEFLAPANPYPGLIGGVAWNHWSGLRSYDPGTDTLQLANPADNWMGVGQAMSRADFDRLGPFSLVRVLHPDLLGASIPPAPPTPPPPPPPPAAPTRAEFDAVIATLTDMRNRAPV